MTWINDRAWQQTIAIFVVVAGAVLIYFGAASTDEPSSAAHIGVALFAIGVGGPLISQVLRARRKDTTRNEDV